ncbi:MAG: hypothetical protein M1820_006809 [Bogoriella megaspora]|nr:MAG: hypothetical protein M1820_006809 [Bogoriella megaspora]
MECFICSSKPSELKQHFFCATCTRASLYPKRIEHATILLEKARLGQQIDTITLPEAPGTSIYQPSLPDGVQAGEAAKNVRLENMGAESSASDDRINTIMHQAELLRKQMEEVKIQIASQRIAASQRRSDRASVSHGLEARRVQTLETTRKGIQRTSHKHDKLHSGIINARASLCYEAANLAGLKQRRRKTRDGGIREDYSIAGTPLLDLRELNSRITKPDHANSFTSALIQTSRLLVLCSNYLHVRLPAEITLPHRDYPLPTILHPQSSYTGREIKFPGLGSLQSSANTPDGSRTFDQRPLPKPRTLCVDREMSKLAKEDPAAYAMFVEGASLLAWDIAWLCRSQGFLTINTWEDVCPFGRNLWQLFVSSVRPPDNKMIPEQGASTLPDLTLGHLSHGTSHSFLGAADAEMHMRAWALRSPVKTLDRVKTHLQADLSRLEWEVLDEREWDEAAQREDEEAVLVGQGRKAEDDGKERDEKGRSVAGWMKLRSRSDDVVVGTPPDTK